MSAFECREVEDSKGGKRDGESGLFERITGIAGLQKTLLLATLFKVAVAASNMAPGDLKSNNKISPMDPDKEARIQMQEKRLGCWHAGETEYCLAANDRTQQK